MPIKGGDEQLIIERVFSRNFAVTEKGIYFMQGPEESSAVEGFAVRYLDLAGGEIRTLTTLRPETKPFYGFTVFTRRADNPIHISRRRGRRPHAGGEFSLREG